MTSVHLSIGAKLNALLGLDGVRTSMLIGGINLIKVIRRSRRGVTVRIVVTEGKLTIPLDPKWTKAERDNAISRAVDAYLKKTHAEKLPAPG